METAERGKTSQTLINAFDALVRWFFWMDPFRGIETPFFTIAHQET